MTRKHFQAIAEVMAETKPMILRDSENSAGPVEYERWQRQCHLLADTLQGFNPAFDRSRFIDACEVRA